MIILEILKIIGIVLACIVGFILLVVLAVLFIPINYKFSAVGENADMDADAEVSWGLRLARAAVSWKEKKLSYQVSIAGKQLFGGVVFGEDKTSDTEEFIPAPEREKEESIPLKKTEGSEKTQILIEEEEPEPLEAKHKTEEEKSEPIEAQAEAEKPEPETAKTEEAEPEGEEVIPENQVTEENKPEERADEEKPEPEAEEVRDTKDEEKRSLKDKYLSFREKLKQFRDKVNNFREQVEEYERIWNAKTTKRAIKKTKIQLLHILNHIKPRKVSGSLKFGLSDPAYTAILYGNAAPILESAAKGKLVITPAFYETGVTADLEIKGRIFLGYMLLCLGRIYLDIDVQRVIKFVRRKLNG